MAEYIVTRQFPGSPKVGATIEISDSRRADTLVRRRYVIPSAGSVTHTEETVARFKHEIEQLKEGTKTIITTAIPLIAVSKLDELLAVVEDTAALTAALEAEARETAVPLIEARLEELQAD